MTKLDKLKARLLQKPKDFRYEELAALLLGLGYEEKKTGKSTVTSYICSFLNGEISRNENGA
jgi:hypothetical protein